MPLLRILGVAFGVAVVIGTSIGTGILRSPGPVVRLTESEPVALLLWVLGGAFVLLAASSLADVATSIPRSGGLYVFAHRALGGGFGFAIGIADWFSNCTAVAFGALSVAEFTAMLAPAAGDYVLAIAGAAIVFFALLQLTGMRVSSRIQEVVSFVKALAFLALIVGIMALGQPADGPVSTATGGVAPLVSIALAMRLVLVAFDGWQSATYFGGEDRDPARNLPRSLIGGVLAVIVIYVLMNVALLRVLTEEALATSTLPAADAAQLVLGDTGATVITFLSILSPLTLISGVLLCAPRIAYAMAADGLLPSKVAFVDARGTPAVALLASTIAAMAMLSSGSFESMATIGGTFAMVSYCGAFVSLLVLRSREPDLPRPFKSWGYPWTTMLVLAAALVLLVGTVAAAPRESAIAIGAMLASYPVYRLTRK